MTVQGFGRYELLAELGRGGMAELHLARLSGIGGFSKLVAVKRMLPHMSQNKQFSDMFVNEGRIVARISHPNVCQVFEIGEANGQLFLVMEYLEGMTWEELVRVLPADRLRIIIGVLAQACDGLHHAHELRDVQGVATPVIHRDVSPQNLFVTVDGVCKVLDFGVAKMQSDVSHTKSGVLKGKIPYMSPEQLRGEAIDCRSDVFAMGIVVWEALAEKHLFVRDGDFQMWKALLEEPIAPPTGDPRVDEVVLRALDRDPARRYSTMSAFADALRGLGDVMPPTELGPLVRAHSQDRLLARQVELAAIDRPAPVVDNTWRDAPTVHDGPAIQSVVLRGEAIAVRPKRRRLLALGGVCIAAIAIALVFVLGGDAAVVDAPTAVAQVVRAPPVETTPKTIEDKTDVIEKREPPIEKKRSPAKRVAARVTPPAPVSTTPGLLSVGAEPTARLYIDGRFIEETPTYRYKLTAGRHELRLVPAGGGKPHQRTIQIEPNRELNLGTVRW